ncbi:MAG: hypothetical protein J5809_06675 [Selenomonadaceae bacterium]|nr:hypothetical protein [Selenomonadaceae bacterium]
MAKIFLVVALIFAVLSGRAFAEEKVRVAVMDLGQYGDSDQIGEMASEYLIEALKDSGKFSVIARDHAAEQIAAANIQTSGIIAPSMARKIAAVLNVDYVIYGTVNGVNGDTMTIEVVSNGADIHTVRAILIVDMMYAKTGRLIVSRGEGASKSSKVKVGRDGAGFVTIGKKKIPQNSVHNAIEKAAYAVVDNMISQLPNLADETD